MTYGCFNRSEAKPTVIAQDGWVEVFVTPASGGAPVRSHAPRMIEIPDPMSKDCKHAQLTPDDPKCVGCCWQTTPQ